MASAASQAAAANSKEAYFVRLVFSDVVRSLEAVSFITGPLRSDENTDILFLACEALERESGPGSEETTLSCAETHAIIAKNESVHGSPEVENSDFHIVTAGKVRGLDARLERIAPAVLQRPRLVVEMVQLLLRILLQEDEENMGGKFAEDAGAHLLKVWTFVQRDTALTPAVTLADALCASAFRAHLLPGFLFDLLPQIRTGSRRPSITDHLKLRLCGLIDDLRAYRSRARAWLQNASIGACTQFERPLGAFFERVTGRESEQTSLAVQIICMIDVIDEQALSVACDLLVRVSLIAPLTVEIASNSLACWIEMLIYDKFNTVEATAFRSFPISLEKLLRGVGLEKSSYAPPHVFAKVLQFVCSFMSANSEGLSSRRFSLTHIEAMLKSVLLVVGGLTPSGPSGDLQVRDGIEPLWECESRAIALLSKAVDRGNLELCHSLASSALPAFVEQSIMSCGTNEQKRIEMFLCFCDFADLAICRYRASELLRIVPTLVREFEQALLSSTGLNLYSDTASMRSLRAEFTKATISLSTLFIRQHNIEPSGLIEFFKVALPQSLFEIGGWFSSYSTLDVVDTRQEDLAKLIIDVLEFGCAAVRNGINRYKLFVFFLPPIYAQLSLLHTVGLLDCHRVVILRTAMQQARSAMNKGSDISLLLSDGIPLIIRAYGGDESVSAEACVSTISNALAVARFRFEANGSYILLLQLKYCHDFFARNGYDIGARQLSRALLQQARREDVKSINAACVPEVLSERYSFLRDAIMTDTCLPPREFSGVCELLARVVKLMKANDNLVVTVIVDDVLDRLRTLSSRSAPSGRPVFSKQDLKRAHDSLARLSLFRALFCTEFTSLSEVVENISDGASESAVGRPYAAEVLARFEARFSSDLLADDAMMENLLLIASRFENRPEDKYQPLMDFARDCVRRFLDGPSGRNAKSTRDRIVAVNEWLHDVPQNVSLRGHLVGCGYAEQLWDRDLFIQVSIDNREDNERAFLKDLLECYNEYLPILRSLGVTHLRIPGGADRYQLENAGGLAAEAQQQHAAAVARGELHPDDVPLDEVFNCDEVVLPIEELQGRRNIANRLAEQLSRTNKQYDFIASRRHTLLQREREIEMRYEQRRRSDRSCVSQQKSYWARLSTSFFTSATSAGHSIAGCYAPNGDHCEKPLEIGIKANLGIISIFEAATEIEEIIPVHLDAAVALDVESTRSSHAKRLVMGAEIENAEVVFCDQGLHIFKKYTNGHAFDTSLVWVSFFKTLIESGYVPSIIVPQGFPNLRTFSVLSSFLEPEFSTAFITFKDDFFYSEGMTTYYDFKPTKIKSGDIVVTRENASQISLSANSAYSVGSDPHGGTMLQYSTELKLLPQPSPQRSMLVERDLCGTIVARTLMTMQETLPQFGAGTGASVHLFGRSVAQYVEKLLAVSDAEEAIGTRRPGSCRYGISDPSILEVGFDLNQWNKRQRRRKLKKRSFGPAETVSFEMTENDKSVLIAGIIGIIHQEFARYVDLNLSDFFKSNTNHFHELRFAVSTLIAQHRMLSCASPSTISSPEALVPAASALKNAISLRSLLRCRSAAAEVLLRNAELYRIHDLPFAIQSDLVRWIFRNEDRVWRDRGGRPGEETLAVFLGTIQSGNSGDASVIRDRQVSTIGDDETSLPYDSVGHHGHEPLPGLVIYESSGTHSSDHVRAYLIGDFKRPDCYEIITAWTDPRFRGLGWAGKLYVKAMVEARIAGADSFAFDLVAGGFEVMTNVTPIYAFLTRINFHKWVLSDRSHSYVVESSSGTVAESFEKFEARLPRLVPMMWLISSIVLWRDRLPRILQKMLLGPASASDIDFHRNIWTDVSSNVQRRIGLYPLVRVLAKICIAGSAVAFVLSKTAQFQIFANKHNR